MAKIVYKYRLGGVVTDAYIPSGAQILLCKKQNDALCIWALVDTTQPPERHRFTIYGTGQPMPDNPGTHIGTFFEYSGTLVFHVFQEKVDG